MDVMPTNSETPSRFASLRAVCGTLSMGRRKAATIAAAALALAVGYHVVFGANGLTVYEQKRHETKDLNEDIQKWQRDNNQLQEQVDQLQNNPDAIEHQAREQLHYTRSGEIIYALPAK
jgi:cell division protein FtsB